MFSKTITPDFQAFHDCILRQDTPKRANNAELFLDGEIERAVMAKFDLLRGLKQGRRESPWRNRIRLQSFLGYDTVRAYVGPVFPRDSLQSADVDPSELEWPDHARRGSPLLLTGTGFSSPRRGPGRHLASIVKLALWLLNSGAYMH